MAVPRKWVITIAIVLVLALSAALLIQSGWFKSKLVSWLVETVKERYGIRLEIRSFSYSLSSGLRAELRGVRAYSDVSDLPFFSAEGIRAHSPYSILWSGRKKIDSIVLQSPSLDIDRLPRWKDSGSGGASAIEVGEIRIETGEARVRQMQLSDLQLQMSITEGRLNVEKASARLHASRVQGRGYIQFEPLILELTYESEGDVAVFADVFSDIPPVSGPFSAKGRIYGKLEDLQIDADVQSTGIRLNDGEATPVQAKITYSLGASGAPLKLQLQWKNFPLAALTQIDPRMPEVASYSTGTLSYTGTTDFWNGSGAFDTDLAPGKGKLPAGGSVTGEISGGSLRITSANLRMRSMQASLTGSLQREAMRLAIDAKFVDLREMSVLVPELHLLPASADVQGNLSGSYSDLAFHGALQLRMKDSELNIERVEYKVAAGTFDADFGGVITGEAMSDMGIPDFSGSIRFAGAASGPVNRPFLNAALSSDDLRIRDIAAGRVQADVQSDGKELKATLQLPDLHSFAQGAYEWRSGRFRLDTKFEETPISVLHSLLPPAANKFEGLFNGSVTIAGNVARWKQAQARLEIVSAKVRHRDWNLESEMNGSVVLEDQRLSANLAMGSMQGSAQIEGWLALSGSREMEVDLKAGVYPAELNPLTSPYEFTGAQTFLNARITGTLENPKVTGKLELTDLAISNPAKKLKLEHLTGSVELQENVVVASLKGVLNEAAISLESSVPLARQPGSVRLSASAVQLAGFFPESNVSGELQIEISATGAGSDFTQWDGSATVQASGLSAAGSSISLAEPLQFRLQNGVVTLSEFRATAADLLDVTGGGSYGLKDGAVAASLNGRADLSLLSEFTGTLQGSGPIQLAMNVGGTVRAPVWNGQISANDVFARTVDYPFVLEQIQLEALFDENGLRFQTFTGKLGGGSVQAAGGMQFENGRPGLIDVQIQGRNIGMNYPEGLRSQLDADLRWQGRLADSELSGEVRVLRSTYREDIDFRDRLINTLLSQQEDLTAPATGPGKLRLNLSVKNVESFRLNNNLARLIARGEFQVSGTLAQPRINGQLRVREGSVLFFEGNEFVVEQAVLSFFGTRDLNPNVDASISTTVSARDGDGEIQDYFITLNLSGPMNDLKRDLNSDPALSESQIYSVLLTGEVRDLGESAGLIFQRQFASYLSGQLFFNFQERIAKALGFSQFEILPPDLISSEEDPGVRLIVSKELTAGLEVQYSSLLSQHTDSTWIVNYRFKNRFSMRFVDQEDGQYTGGLRHSLRFGAGSETRRTTPRRTQKIVDLQILNESVLDDQTIRETLDLRQGHDFDRWSVEDNADKVKQILQRRGFLFPLVDISDNYDNGVFLNIRVSDQGKRRMEFSGIDVSKESAGKYERWWREGLSETVVVQQITEDLLAQLFRAGYHQAKVISSRNEIAGEVVYNFSAETGPLFNKMDVQFEGNDHYPLFELERDLVTLYGSREEMQRAALHRFHSFVEKIAALYVQRGYLDASIESGGLAFTAPVATRKVLIVEGRSSRITELEFSGDGRIPEDLLQRLRMVPGAVFDSRILSEDEVTIADYFHDQGFWTTRLTSDVRRTGKGLVISYDLQVGKVARIGAIRISGNRKTRNSLILRRISLRPGDLLTRDALMQTQNRIEELRVFRQVRVEPKQSKTADVYDLEIQVVEREPYELTYGLRYDSEFDLEGEVQLRDSNLFGTGQNVLLYGRWNSLENIYRVIFHSAPGAVRKETLLTIPWRTLLSFSYEDREMTSFFSKVSSVNFQRRWEFLKPFVFLTNYKFEQGRTTSKTSGGPIDFDIKQNVSRLIGVVILDTRDDPMDPRRGLLVTNEIEHAPDFLKSDLVFTKNYSQYFQYFSFGRIVSASAFRLGVGSDLIGSERFFAGGQGTLRGFELDEVGPRRRDLPIGGQGLLIVNQEVRVPLYSWLGGVLFYDGGNVYANASDISLSDLRHSAGFGLRLTSPYGIGRFDIGFNLDPQDDEPSYVLHFGFGQAW